MINKIRIIWEPVFIFLIISILSDTCFSVILVDEIVIGLNRKIPQTQINLSETSHSFVEVAKLTVPSVVSIQSTMIMKTKDIWKQRFDDETLRHFLEERDISFPIPSEFRQRGSGSGIIISDQGHILTNVHVVDHAEDIKVTLHDKRTFDAEIIGIDPLTEIAIIRINGTDLPAAALGNSDSCQIGEWVLAIGNPLELNSTVTAGIISAKGRDINIIKDTYGVENFIQTDAAINPGNSGGPIVNLKGEVIGITTAIATESGYNQGYGFAIPINLAKEIIEDLNTKGRVVRGYLGISMQDIDEKRARALGFKKPIGVFIDSVLEDGPAYQAGLRPKDVLIKIDKETVMKANVVQNIISRTNPGDEALLTVIRKNKILKLNVLLGERQNTIITSPTMRRNINYRFLGLEVQNLKNHSSINWKTKDDYGVIITEVERFSPAFEAGIQVNDVILEIGDITISSVDIFRSVIDSLKKGEVTIIKIRRADTIFHAFVEVP